MVERLGNINPSEFSLYVLSTDTKPVTGIGGGSTLFELDTKKVFIYSTVNTNPVTGNGWWEV